MRNEAIDEAIDETIFAVYQNFEFDRFQGRPREEWMGALHKYLAKTTVTTVVRAFHKENPGIRNPASPTARRIHRTVTPEELHEALAQLNKQDRMLLDAFIVDGRSYFDIAEQFTGDFGAHFNEDQLKTRKLRAIAVLRRALLKRQ